MDISWTATTKGRSWYSKEPSSGGGPSLKSDLELTGRDGQTITGFGGCFNELGAKALSFLSSSAKEEVIRNLFGDDGCSFGFCRMPIGASDYGLEWYSLADKPDDIAMEHFSVERDRGCLIPYIKSAAAVRPSLSLFASPWSPPAWMKTHRVCNFGVLRDEPEIKDAYALYFVKTVEAYAKEGLRIVQIHPQNEPVADQKFPSCLWTGAKMRDFIRDHLGPVFAKHKVPAEIWLGTLNCDNFNEWILKPLSDPGCARLVKGVGLQWWGKHIIQRIRHAFPDLPLSQTENECGDGSNSWDYAHYIFDLIWHYLQNGVQAYTYWNMVLPTGGESSWGWKQNSMICVDPATRTAIYNPEFWVMKHLTHAVPPGSVRIETKGRWSGNSLAFRRPDGARVVVCANPLPEERTLVIRDDSSEEVSAVLEPSSFHTFILK